VSDLKEKLGRVKVEITEKEKEEILTKKSPIKPSGLAS
jgi:hypothetical protein